MKYYLGIINFGAVLLLAACTTANADMDLKWTHHNNQGEAKNHVAEEINNLKYTPQEAVDKINSLYEGTVVEVELDGDDGVYYYEIEIVNGDIKYYSKVDAENLELIKLEKSGADSEEPLNSVQRITPESALDIADDEVDGEITAWELENDEYKILIETDSGLVKIEIDALTANILDKEIQMDEKKKVNGSGGKGEKSADDKDAEDEKTEEPVENKDSKTEKSEGTANKDDEKDSRSEPVLEESELADTSVNEGQRSSDDGKQQSPDYQNGILTSEAAINIALNAVGGIVIEWEYDDEDFEYEIELIANGQEVEVKINSLNGGIQEIEYDD